MFKYLAVGSLTLIALTGCGEENVSLNSSNGNNSNTEEVSNGSSGSSGIVAGSMEPSLTLESTKDGKATFSYSIQNQTEKVQTVVFPSSQKYDYKLYNEAGDHLKTYSANRSFIKEIKKVQVKQAETLDYTISLDQLSSGSYTLEVWLTVEGESDYKKTIDFTIQ